MNLRFAHDEIKEFAEGNLHFKNDGEAFTVESALLADELLHKKAWVAGEWVNVFAVAGEDEKPVPMTETGLMKLTKPELIEIGQGLDAGVTADNNKAELVAKILATQTEEDN